MNEYMQFSAKTKNEAITKACIELGVTSDQLDIQVISEGSSGFFGIGSKPAIIKARKVEDHSEEKELEEIVASVKLDAFKDEPKPEQKKSSPKPAPKAPARTSNKPEAKPEAGREEKPAKPVREKQPKERVYKEKPVREPKPAKEKPVRVSKPIEIITDPAEIKEIEERASVFLHDVFASMDTTDGCLEVDFEGQDMGILIGKRGQTLDSLQYLTSLVVNKGKSDYIRVKLDTEDYRRRRKETLENLARGIAYKVKKTRKPVVLEPMNPYERRIIHSALQGNKFVETVSEGEEPYRHVVVKLKRY